MRFFRSNRDELERPSVSRRNFLRVTAGGLVGTTLLVIGIDRFNSLKTSPSADRPTTGSPVLASLDDLMQKSFADHLGDTFGIRKNALEAIDVELIEVSSVGPGSSGPATDATARTVTESFSVIFKGALDPSLEQDTYTVEHRTLGAFPLFIVPIGPEGPHVKYEAVFNRLKT